MDRTWPTSAARSPTDRPRVRAGGRAAALSELQVGRIPPIRVDAQRLNVDAALVHGGNALRAERPSGRKRAPRECAAGEQVRDLGKYAMRVNVDDRDAASAYAHSLAQRVRESRRCTRDGQPHGADRLEQAPR